MTTPPDKPGVITNSPKKDEGEEEKIEQVIPVDQNNTTTNVSGRREVVTTSCAVVNAQATNLKVAATYNTVVCSTMPEYIPDISSGITYSSTVRSQWKFVTSMPIPAEVDQERAKFFRSLIIKREHFFQNGLFGEDGTAIVPPCTSNDERFFAIKRLIICYEQVDELDKVSRPTMATEVVSSKGYEFFLERARIELRNAFFIDPLSVEVSRYLDEFHNWLRKHSDARNLAFWRVISSKMIYLRQRLSNFVKYSDAEDLDLLEVPRDEHCGAYMSWAHDSDSSDDDDDKEKKAIAFLKMSAVAKNASGGLLLPFDTENTLPYIWEVLQDFSKEHNVPIELDPDVSWFKGSIKEPSMLSFDKFSAAQYAQLDKSVQEGIDTVRELTAFIVTIPINEVLGTSKLHLPAAYVLHYHLFDDDRESNAKIALCLKNPNGGRDILARRACGLMKQDTRPMTLLLEAYDRIFRFYASELRKKDGLLPETLSRFLKKQIFTSPNGIAEHFYRKESRIEVIQEQVPDLDSKKKDAVKVISKKKTVIGHKLPNLHVKSDLLKVEEKLRLTEYAKRFNPVAIVNNLPGKSVQSRADLNLVDEVRKAVQDAYAISDLLGSELGRRKELVRAACSKTEGKIPQSEFLAKRDTEIPKCKDLDIKIYEEIERFLVKYRV